jgi:hypothetical protein
VILFVVAAGIRLAWILLQTWRTEGAFSFPDEIVYWSMADSLAKGLTMQDHEGMKAGQMPLYPALLALFGHGLAGPLTARCAQAGIGASVAPLVALLAVKFSTRSTAILAGAIAAVDPFSIYFSHLILTETLFATALVAFCLVAWPKDATIANPPPAIAWIPAGILLGVCLYLRPSAAAFAMWWIGLEAASSRRWAPSIQKLALIMAVACLSLVPWAGRNQSAIGEWTWLTQRTGISLYDGVGPQATGASDLADVKNSPEITQLSEPGRNRYFLEASIDAIRQNPSRILSLAVTKLLRTWSPRIHAESGQSIGIQIISISWSLAIYLCTLVGIVNMRHRAGLIALLLAPATYFSLIHMLFVGSVRYRLPAMPMMEILAAIGLAVLVSTFRSGPCASHPAAPLAPTQAPGDNNDRP